MDGTQGRISPQELHNSIGTAAAPLVIDVRRPDAFDADDIQIVGAIRRLPDEVDRWRHELPDDRRVVVYCVRGQQVSQGVAAALAAAGIDADYLEGGITTWRECGLSTRRRIGPAPSKWVTRERPRVDRIACPWLIRRFIDPETEFLYVPSAQVRV
jgi:rhodanese-related sulfurtransferase